MYRKKKTETKRYIKKGEHNYRRDWEVHENLSTVPGDQPWQEYDYRESGGLAGRRKLTCPRHEENTTKKNKEIKDGRYFGGLASLQGYRGST